MANTWVIAKAVDGCNARIWIHPRTGLGMWRKPDAHTIVVPGVTGARSAWLHFKEANKSKKIEEQTALWKTISVDDKKVYDDLALKDKLRFDTACVESLKKRFAGPAPKVYTIPEHIPDVPEDAKPLAPEDTTTAAMETKEGESELNSLSGPAL